MAVVRSKTGQQTNTFYLKDYKHAANTFLPNAQELSPKYGFLFHVVFNFNSPGSQILGGLEGKTISVLCKSADLPKFNIEYDTLNKYNKPEIVPKKLKYEPVNLSFHDDVKNTIRDLWITYNQYYFADSKITPEAWATDDTYLNKWNFNRYGLDQGPDVKNMKFLNSVDIYSMGNHRFTRYSLINPLIVSFDFDKHDYSEGSKTMETQIRLEYETVLYYEGSTEGTNIPGFGKDSPFYDQEQSTLPPQQAASPPNPPLADTTIVKSQPSNRTQPYSTQVTRTPVQMGPALLSTVKAVAANSRNTLRNYSFPTAYSITNNSAMVYLTGKARLNRQGFVARAGFVTSNGTTISVSVGSYGQNYSNENSTSKIIINPRIPYGLTTSEQQAFLRAYPPLPSTNLRTRSAPYV